MQMSRLVFVVGPTASGKSDFAIEVCAQTGGAIMNADSLQVYRGLDVGTAKPSREVRSRAPHFLFDQVELGGSFTAGDFRRCALEIIEKTWAEKPLFVVGGSGFYIQALEKGMYPSPTVPVEIRNRVRDLVDQQGLRAAYAELEERDPEYAAKIPPTDSYRIFRALTLILTTGRTMSSIQKEFSEKAEALPYPITKLGLYVPRERLRERVEARVHAMLRAGLIEEVEGLVKQGLSSWPPMQSVGYKEVLAHLRGEYSRDEMIQWITTHTMQLAKRQMTWFRRDPQIRWFNVESEWESGKKFVLDSLSTKPPLRLD